MPMTTDDSHEAASPIELEADETEATEQGAAIDHNDATIQADATEPRDTIDHVAADATTSPTGDEDEIAFQDNPELIELAVPFVGQWKQLISKTNWEKGRIIAQWREALIESGADATHYSDEAWARRVGGVTAPHVGRLRRVHDRFASTFATYEGLYWSHFLAALDWDDAPLWLEGACQESWSVANMRQQRWQAHGAVESQRPTGSQIIEVDTDEDITLPAQGGGRTKQYGDEPDGVASGPRPEDPDFGEEEELMSLGSGAPPAKSPTAEQPSQAPVQPFAGLPELPDDLADAIETLKLSILRHKSAGWADTDIDTVQKYLDAIGVMLRS
jgi:hypothetical protein